jgi:hypothetical protein
MRFYREIIFAKDPNTSDKISPKNAYFLERDQKFKKIVAKTSELLFNDE